MASSACSLRTVASARGSERTENPSQDHIPDPAPEQSRGKPPALPSGLLAPTSRTPETCCSGGGNSPLSTERGSPCARGGRPVPAPAVPGRASRAQGTPRPREPLRLAGSGLERGGGPTNPAPGARGPEAPAVRPSASRRRARGRGAAPGLRLPLAWPGRPRGEPLSTPGPVPSPPSVSSRGDESRPEEGSQPGPRTPTPPGLARGEEPEPGRPDPAACAARARAGRQARAPGRGRSRAPEGPADSPPLRAPRGLPTPTRSGNQ